jgi:lysophospholipase L1-like esterase
MKTFWKAVALTIIIVLMGMLFTPGEADAAERRAVPLIAVGDSIVQGVGVSDPNTMSWPARIGAVRTGSSGGCVIAQGCFGQRPMVEQFDQVVLPYLGPGTKLIVAYGINDIARGTVSAQQIVDGLANLVWRARQAGAKVYVQTLTPVGPNMWFMGQARVEVNNLIKARFANVINQDQLLLNSNNGMIWVACDSGDNLHPNSEGYRRMAQVARAAIG